MNCVFCVKISKKVRQEKLLKEIYQVFMCWHVLNILHYVFWDRISQKII